MDSWIVVLRGQDDVLVEARAVLGAPASWADCLESYFFETLNPSDAAAQLCKLTPLLQQGIAGAVALESEFTQRARERAVALACAAEEGELLLEAGAHRRLERELFVVKPKSRPTWKLPCYAVAMAPEFASRAEARERVRTLPLRPALVARNREVSALLACIERSCPVIVHAEPGAGASRVIEEAARRVGRAAVYLPSDILHGSLASVERALQGAPADAWVIADPLPESARTFVPIAEELGRRRTVIVRVSRPMEMTFRVPPEGITLGALRDYDARALVRQILGEPTDPRIERRLARKGEMLPGRIAHAVRAAIQLGSLVLKEGQWRKRERPVLRRKDSPRVAINARIEDMDMPLRAALATLTALGDGRSLATAAALLRGLFGQDPQSLLSTLISQALVHDSNERVRIDESVRIAAGAPSIRAVEVLHSGAVALAAQGERLLGAQQATEAARTFAQAAATADKAGLKTTALRYLVLARREFNSLEVATIARAILDDMGPVVSVTVTGGLSRPSRSKPLDAVSLESAAGQLDAQDDPEGAQRLRTLAALVRGNVQRALQLADARGPEDHQDAKTLLTAALAQASTGDMGRAVRSTLAALATARSRREGAGEVAALSLLSTFYRALGREEASLSFAEASRRLMPPVASPA
ncbi:MAG: hypothetical protein Q8Q09_27485 [Deltaproteobacteria bacterium]|nr:hypothetical protein [Deltaproteobacteria bacterium]